MRQTSARKWIATQGRNDSEADLQGQAFVPVLAPVLAIALQPEIEDQIARLPAQAMPSLLSEAELSVLREAPLMPFDPTSRFEQAVPFVILAVACHPGLDEPAPDWIRGGPWCMDPCRMNQQRIKRIGGNTAIATEAHLGACCIASSQTLGNKCQYQGIERHALSFRPGCQLKVHGAGEPCKDFA